MIFIMMGVSGCGKTAVGQELAKQLSCDFHDGDDHHSKENKSKMAANIPLDDEDRFPWLLSIHECIKRYKHAHKNAVVACSALKQQYRHILRHGKADIHQQLTDSRVLAFGLQNTVTSSTHDVTESLVTDMVFVYLKGNKKLLASRLQERQGHFFPPLLLDSQIAALEEPTESEHSMLIDIEKSVDEIVRVIMKSFQTS